MGKTGSRGTAPRRAWAIAPILLIPLGLAVVGPAPAGAGPALYKAPAHYPVGDFPISVAVADVNGDGRPDLVVADQLSDQVSVLLGQGDGTFGAQSAFAANGRPGSVAVADFDGDGRPDLAVTNPFMNTVSVFLGNGDGTFGSPTAFATGSQPAFVAVADLNADGRPDLAVANSASDTVSVLLGNGDGTFGSAPAAPAPSSPVALALADVNGDARTDLAVANQGSNSVSVLLGNGDGTFGSATVSAAGSGPSSLAAGDLDGDNQPDLAVANQGSNDVSVLLGNGNGTFRPQTLVGAGTSRGGIAMADMDSDGRLDLVTANAVADSVSVFLGTGDGTFGAPTDLAVGASPRSVAVADLNGDGRPDVVAANANSDTVTVLPGDAVPVATADAYPGSEDTALSQAAPGVLGNDHDSDDGALTAVLATSPTRGTLTAFQPDGSFTYTPQADYSGTVTFTYRAQDPAGNLSSPVIVTLTLAPVNDPPVAADDARATAAGTPVSVPVTANDTDIDGDPLTVSGNTAPASGTATCSGTACTYTPQDGFSGSDAFTYTVADGQGGTASASVAVTVAAAHVPAAADDTASVAEDVDLPVAVTTNDVLGDEPTTVTLATAPAHGSAACTGLTCTYTPAPDYHGADAFTYTLGDADGDTSTARVAVTVTPINDPPSLALPAAPPTLVVGGALAGLSARDPDGDRLTFVLVSGALPDGVSLNLDGTFAGAATTAGVTVARVRACDPNGACDEGDLRVQVRAAAEQLPRLPATGAGGAGLTLAGLALMAGGGCLTAAAGRPLCFSRASGRPGRPRAPSWR